MSQSLGNTLPVLQEASWLKTRLYWASKGATKMRLKGGRSLLDLTVPHTCFFAPCLEDSGYETRPQQPVLHFGMRVPRKTPLLMICRRCQSRLPCDPLWMPQIFWNVAFLPYIWVPLSRVEQQVPPPKQAFPQFWSLQLLGVTVPDPPPSKP